MRARCAALAALGAVLLGPAAAAQVTGLQKLSSTSGGFGAGLDDGDSLGSGLAYLGDLDGDGVGELAVGAAGDDDGAAQAGAVWVLFQNADGTVRAKQKISALAGGFGGALITNDLFGGSLSALGDLDGDGLGELAVGAPYQETGGPPGTAWVLSLNDDGTVAGHVRITQGSGGFLGPLDDGDRFGSGVAALGDLDGDGVSELAVGAPRDDDGGPARGAVWVLFLNADGTVASHTKISDTQGGFGGGLADLDDFGFAVAGIGDLDGDGTNDLAVGVPFADDGGPDRGAVWILLLNPDGTVRAWQKIAQGHGGFTGLLGDGDLFGAAVARLDDRNGDGVAELAVGAVGDVDGVPDGDAVWILFLEPDGTVAAHEKISATRGCGSALDGLQLFGTALVGLPDAGGDGAQDLAVGDRGAADGGPGRGAVWQLLLAPAVAASEAVRPGVPPNPVAFLPGTNAPVLGTVWNPGVDHALFLPQATSAFALVDLGPPLNAPTSFGTLLCNLPPAPQIFVVPAGSPFAIAVPNDCSLLGASVCAQGGAFRPGAVRLANALDATIGSY